ncbi:amidohydrolase family protein [Paraglaciecola sp. 2405UD69-4]|uniref:amidohydrolase family protein n=1 Tax=Paraglaciecola sp. 2405UD69-4 TaxID=3391836 RepID=UPI0039C9BCC3
MNYLIKNAVATIEPQLLDTVEAVSHSMENAAKDIRISKGIIVEMGLGLPLHPNEVLVNASDCVVYPGLVNTHHHLAQSVLKGIPAGLNSDLGHWLAEVPFRFWPHIDPQLMYDAAILGLAELLRSGATTCCDHHYLYHASVTPEIEDALWQAASDIGMRLVLCRGGATATGSHKGLQKAAITPETISQMLNRLDDTRSRYHQAGPNGMRRLVVAPTSLIHSTKAEDLKTLAAYARNYDLKMHSHLLEVDFDEQQCRNLYGKSAVAYAQGCDWLGEDVWFAHLVKASSQDINLLAKSGTSISHCPTSNCRLGSGIAPVVAMREAGMNITLGVDGSASSESASMIQELNLAWLLHRSGHGANATRATQVAQWGTQNAAKLLGLDAIGALSVGKAADLVLFDISHFRYWGMHSKSVAPIIAGEPVSVKTCFINGKLVIDDGNIKGINLADRQTSLLQGLARLKQKVGDF